MFCMMDMIMNEPILKTDAQLSSQGALYYSSFSNRLGDDYNVENTLLD